MAREIMPPEYYYQLGQQIRAQRQAAIQQQLQQMQMAQQQQAAQQQTGGAGGLGRAAAGLYGAYKAAKAISPETFASGMPEVAGEALPQFGSILGGGVPEMSLAQAYSPTYTLSSSLASQPAYLASEPAFGSVVSGGVPEFSAGIANSPEAVSAVGAPEVGGAFNLSGVGSAGNAILPIAGAVGAYDLFANKRKGARGALQGATSGAAMGSYFGPMGAAIGGGVGLGAGLLGGALNRKSTKEIEADRWKSIGREDLGNARKGQDYFAGTGGEKSRDERFLTPDAIRVNPDNYNNISDWDNWSRANQDAFLKEMLAQGKVREKKGGIYYDDDYAKQLAGQIRGGTFKPSAPQPISGSLPPMQRPIMPQGGRSEMAPDGINTMTTLPNGQKIQTLIGKVDPSNLTGILKAVSGQNLQNLNFSPGVIDALKAQMGQTKPTNNPPPVKDFWSELQNSLAQNRKTSYRE